MRRFLLVGLALLPALGCTHADPLAGRGSTSDPAVQKNATEVQTRAAAGLAVTPLPASDSQVCAYDTEGGHVTLTLPATQTCPLKPPAKAR